MTDDRSKALVPQDPTSLSPLSRLAERTLAEREERALVAARTLVVGPGAYATISEAVAAARDGDTVLIRPGRYKESVIVQGKTIAIRGDGDRDAVVVGWDQGPAFTLVETRSTLTALTIIGGGPSSASETGAGLRVAGGAPQLKGLRVTADKGIEFNSGAVGTIEHSQFCGKDRGISVGEGSSPRIEENEICVAWLGGISIEGARTDPLVHANRIHDGKGWGIFVAEGASPQIEENEIWESHSGISIFGGGANPLVRANRVHDCEGDGISIYAGASPQITENEIWATMFGITIGGAGTDPLIRANKVHDGKETVSIGVHVWDGASPRIEDNEIWAYAWPGIRIDGANTAPVVIGNVVRDGFNDGILVLHGASPTITGNTVTGNAGEAIRVDSESAPTIGHNVVSP